jgi:hypothetical protein
VSETTYNEMQAKGEIVDAPIEDPEMKHGDNASPRAKEKEAEEEIEAEKNEDNQAL